MKHLLLRTAFLLTMLLASASQMQSQWYTGNYHPGPRLPLNLFGHSMSIWPLDPPHFYPNHPVQETQLIFAIGGAHFSGSGLIFNDSIYEIAPDDWDRWNSSSSQGWTSRTVLPTPRTGLGSVTLNNLVYVIGGSDGSGALGTVEIYDPVTNSWTTGTPMPTPRADMAIAVVNRQIYLIGGRDLTGPLGTVEIYDPANDSWSVGPTMPSPAYGIGVLYNRLRSSPRLSVPGGVGLNGISNEIRYFDPSTNLWGNSGTMASGRAFYGTMVDNGMVAGGFDQFTGQIVQTVGVSSTASPWATNMMIFSSPVADFGYVTYYRQYSVHSGYSGGRTPNPTDSTFAGLEIIVLDQEGPILNLSESGNGFLLDVELPTTVDWYSVTLERSPTGEFFSELASEEAPAAAWSYVDESPFSASTFYRVKAIDLQGQFHLSEVVQGLHPTSFSFSISPNPAQNEAVVVLAGQNGKKPLDISIYDLSGKQLFQRSQLPSSEPIQLDLRDLPKGNLFIKVSNSSGSFHRVLVHQ